MEFHILSFEGPDPYSRAGGIASRITGLAEALALDGLETHLWFIGDPNLPGHEDRGQLHLHRWCQWISSHHPSGVYDGEEPKSDDYAKSLPPWVLPRMAPRLLKGGRAVVLAEEWHTANAVIHLDHLLRGAGLRDRVSIFWNANNTFGFDRIEWPRLEAACVITTVSKYMKQWMLSRLGVDAVVIPNGIEPSAFGRVDPGMVREFRNRMKGRTVLAKVARWDPDKRWLMAVDIAHALKQRGGRPLLIARGGLEAHGHDVVQHAQACGLKVEHREIASGAEGLLRGMDAPDTDVLVLSSHLDPGAKRLLYRAASAVLANSSHEPFGLVGLEAMAASGVACTGCSGEDYAIPGRNAVVLQTDDPLEAVASLERLRSHPQEERALRREARNTAERYAWDVVVERNLLPRIELSAGA